MKWAYYQLIWKNLARLLTYMQDPEPERSSQPCQGTLMPHNWGWLPALALLCALGICSVSYAYTSARYGSPYGLVFLWFGLLLIYAPSALRLLGPTAQHAERLGIICLSALSFYIAQSLFSPLRFSSYDEFLHWRTASDIVQSGHLFNANALLPVSPFYPGLEIVTTALSTLSGISIFQASLIALGLARLVMVLALFLLYERILRSARQASIATLLYMANPHFLLFDAKFSYESLALPFAVCILCMLAYYEEPAGRKRWPLLAACLLFAGLVATHHMTSFVLTAALLLWSLLAGRRSPSVLFHSRLLGMTLFALIASVTDILLIGKPVVGYLSGYFSAAFDELGHILTGTSKPRQLFVIYAAGPPAPSWERWVTASSVALLTLGLLPGLLCLLLRYRSKVLACMFGIAALLYPLSQVFRFTNFGSEITDRAAAFLFVPLACLLTVGITQLWPVRSLRRPQLLALTSMLILVFVGGVMIGSGPLWERLPGPYLVAADERSIDPEGIQAALWAQEHLGPDNRLATDRVNQLLMSTYGDQHIVNNLADSTDVSELFFAPGFGTTEAALLKHGQIRYLLVDRRLSTALPNQGFYFEAGEEEAFQRRVPLNPQFLAKFDTLSQMDRVFDSGNLVLYDTGLDSQTN